MKKIVRRETRFRCDVCKTEYDNKKDAKLCESRLVEMPMFRKGDAVRAIEGRRCVCSKTYLVRGMVTRVIGPVLMDEEYSKKWLNGWMLGRHVFEFGVSFTTPCCEEKTSAIYYGLELKSLCPK
ncbi:MAG: hypothetical protein Q8L24_00390 [bacterium]|nr:hypothetical protein [bacterium]